MSGREQTAAAAIWGGVLGVAGAAAGAAMSGAITWAVFKNNWNPNNLTLDEAVWADVAGTLAISGLFAVCVGAAAGAKSGVAGVLGSIGAGAVTGQLPGLFGFPAGVAMTKPEADNFGANCLWGFVGSVTVAPIIACVGACGVVLIGLGNRNNNLNVLDIPPNLPENSEIIRDAALQPQTELQVVEDNPEKPKLNEIALDVMSESVDAAPEESFGSKTSKTMLSFNAPSQSRFKSGFDMIRGAGHALVGKFRPTAACA